MVFQRTTASSAIIPFPCQQRDPGRKSGSGQPFSFSLFADEEGLPKHFIAAEASHFSEAMEAGDWLAVLLDEALHGEQDLKRWDRIVEQRRLYVTDSRLPAQRQHKH